MSTLSVSVVVMEGENVLLIEREDFRVWGLPGGRIEPGETVAEAAVREVLEETGVRVRLLRLVGIYARPGWRGDTHGVVFAAAPVEGDLRTQDGETIDARYFPGSALPERLVWWHYQPIQDAFAGCGGSVVWRQDLSWPFEGEMTYSRVSELRDQGAIPAELLTAAWKHWCREPGPGEQRREV